MRLNTNRSNNTNRYIDEFVRFETFVVRSRLRLNTNRTNYTNHSIAEFVRFEIFVVEVMLETEHESLELHESLHC